MSAIERQDVLDPLAYPSPNRSADWPVRPRLVVLIGLPGIGLSLLCDLVAASPGVRVLRDAVLHPDKEKRRADVAEALGVGSVTAVAKTGNLPRPRWLPRTAVHVGEDDLDMRFSFGRLALRIMAERAGDFSQLVVAMTGDIADQYDWFADIAQRDAFANFSAVVVQRNPVWACADDAMRIYTDSGQFSSAGPVAVRQAVRQYCCWSKKLTAAKFHRVCVSAAAVAAAAKTAGGRTRFLRQIGMASPIGVPELPAGMRLANDIGRWLGRPKAIADLLNPEDRAFVWTESLT